MTRDVGTDLAHERRRLEQNYERFDAGTRRARYSGVGNDLMVAERWRVIDQLVERAGATVGPLLLEIGVGPGANAEALCARGVEGTSVVGVDLSTPRLEAARPQGVLVARADGTTLPLRDSSVDTVVLFTVLSSITAEAAIDAIASESARVLRANGSVLWYDLRYPSPANRTVRPVTARKIRRLFPGFRIAMQSLTVLPPISRGLARVARGRSALIYDVVRSIPPLRSHLGAVLVKEWSE